MRFSIIIPVYNVEKFLVDCIESILSQNYKNFELILVNDGSTDTSGEICDFYKKQFPEKVKVLHKKNEGVMLARVDGLKLANSDYILFYDSDDTVRIDALQILNDTINETDSDLIIYNYSRDEDYLSREGNYKFKPNDFISRQMICESVLDRTIMNTLWVRCIKKELLMPVNEYSECKGYNLCEDLIVALEIVDKCVKPYYLDETLYFYRTNVDGISKTYHRKMYESVVMAHKLASEYSAKWDMEYDSPILTWVVSKVLSSNLTNKEKRHELRRIISDNYFKETYKQTDKSIYNFKKRITIQILVFLSNKKIL